MKNKLTKTSFISFFLIAGLVIFSLSLIKTNKKNLNKLEESKKKLIELSNKKELIIESIINEEQIKELKKSKKQIKELKKKYAWHRWFHSEYAAELRRVQYGEATNGINELLVAHKKEFIPIESVTESVVCSKKTNTVFDKDFIYWGARILPLKQKGQQAFYAISYLGAGDFAHSNKSFDSFVNEIDFKKPITYKKNPHGLTESWLSKHKSSKLMFDGAGRYGYSAVFSYNSGDIDGDNKDDFIFDDLLITSSSGYKTQIPAPRRAIFYKGLVIGIENNQLTFFKFHQGELKELNKTQLKTSPHPDTPYVLFPLPENFIAVHTLNSLDIYKVDSDSAQFFTKITGLEKGEVQVGAFADFTGDAITDFWISQVNTPVKYPNKRDRASLIDIQLLQKGTVTLNDITFYKIFGSPKYSDYDGIASTMSPRAGDIDGDGLPDFTFTGHRHMNEAGALYILPGKQIKKGKELRVSAPQIVKILGRPMSQLAPPFHHWDATDFNTDRYDDIVVSVDNDVCAGLHSGSLYLLDGKKIFQAYKKMMNP